MENDKSETLSHLSANALRKCIENIAEGLKNIEQIMHYGMFSM